MAKRHVPIDDLNDPECAALTVPGTAAYFGVSRNAGYRAAAEGAWPTIRVGRAIRVPAVWVRAQLGVQTTSPSGADAVTAHRHGPTPPPDLEP